MCRFSPLDSCTIRQLPSVVADAHYPFVGQWSSAGKLSVTLLDMSWASSAGMTSSKLDTMGINELVLLESMGVFGWY